MGDSLSYLDNLLYQSHSPQSRKFDIGDSYMKVALLRLLEVTKVQDGGTSARAKRESRPPKRFVDEIEQLKPCAMKKTPKRTITSRILK